MRCNVRGECLECPFFENTPPLRVANYRSDEA